MSELSNNSSPMIRSFRKDFIKGMLIENEISKDPIEQFSAWLDFAFKSDEYANAMVLSTVSEDLMPSSRVVLLRDISYGGLTFFTNYASQKGIELEKNPKASVLFFWPALERQVSISGTVTKLPVKESDEYFESRPFESKVGAWVSKQSSVISSRLKMDEDFTEQLKKYPDKKVPRPPHWGGYVLIPSRFEFWQGRESRMHDRIRYRLNGNKEWIMERLMP
jgi:pyridoxamine 5'-phosphate oxidase